MPFGSGRPAYYTCINPISFGFAYTLFVFESLFRREAYLSVLIVWSAELLPGFMHAIMTILELVGFKNESRSTMVSFEALKGTWSFFISRALMHSFKANKLLLIFAPSILRCRLLLRVSAARSDPAKSTKSNLPTVLPAAFLTLIWQMACDLDEVSFATVEWVVLSPCPYSIIWFISLALDANLSVNPFIWILFWPSSYICNSCLWLSKSRTLPP